MAISHVERDRSAHGSFHKSRYGAHFRHAHHGGSFSPTITVADGNTLPVSTTITWAINNVLTVQPLSGSAVAAGSTVSLNVQSSGGLNPRYSWNFGDGSPATSFSSSSSTSHLFSNPGRYLVTVTAQDDTGRQVTASYRQGVYAPLTATRPTASSGVCLQNSP